MAVEKPVLAHLSQDRGESLATVMAAAYDEHLNEVAVNPSIRKQSRYEFVSIYGPASDDGLIDYFARRSTRIAQVAFKS